METDPEVIERGEEDEAMTETAPSGIDTVVKAPVDVLDFSTLGVDELAARLVDRRILEAILKQVALPSFGEDSDAMIPAGQVIDAMRRMAEVVAALQSRLTLLETSIASERRAGRGTAVIDAIAGEDPTRRAIRRLEQRDVATVVAAESAFGRNWWPPEMGDDASWRWSGPKEHSTVLLPSAGLEEGWVSIEFGNFGGQSLKETFARVRPAFFLDDQRLEFDGIARLGDETRAILAAPFSHTHGTVPTHYVLHVQLEKLQRPADEIPGSADRRRLGLNVSRIIVSATPWN